MADAPVFNWRNVNGEAVKQLRKPKIPEVPKEIVALAQDSLKGRMIDVDGEPTLSHVLRYDFGPENVEMANAFAKHMKNAGHHTSPQSTVAVAQDPDRDGSQHVVTWAAGGRRGKRAKQDAEPVG